MVTPARADEDVPRHWIAHVGVHPIDSKPDNHAELGVDSAAGVSLGATCLLTKHWAIELFAAFPTAHDVHAAECVKSARFSMIPGRSLD